MRILVASDLHFEFQRDHGKSLVASLAEADVLVCAGDLTASSGVESALELLCDKYQHVVYVPGNHEFYGSSIPTVRKVIQLLASRLERLHYLDNSSVELEGRKFLGTTMWFRRQPGIEMYHSSMSDFSVIRQASRDIYAENERAVLFLEQHVTSETIVVTHHLPSIHSIHQKWRSSLLNCFFLCDMQRLIETTQPPLWIHGHTHESMDFTIGATRVVCNPFGYAGRETNFNFTEAKILDI